MNKQNLPLAKPNADVQEASSHFTQQVLSSGQNADQILKQAEKYPDSVLLQSFAAAFYLFAQTKEASQSAKKFLEQADKYLNKAHLREKMWYQAMLAWLQQDYELAITLLMAIARQWPKDVLAIKLVEWLNYCSGQVPTAKSMLNFCQELAKHNKDNSHFLAIYAFSHELNNNLDEAYRIASEAVAIERKTPWAHHTLAHYYLRTGQIKQGLKVLEDFRPSWKDILILLRGHNTWHLALHYLADLDQTKTLELFDQEIWGNWPNNVLEQIDAISLLWRMDMAGMKTENRWQDIVNHMDQYAYDHYAPFNNLHHFYALVRIGKEQEANDALITIKAYAKENDDINHRRWQQVAIPALEGIIAFAKQEFSKVCQVMEPIIDDIFSTGGSDAQNELFTQTLLVAALKSKQNKMADRIMNVYLPYYKQSSLGEYWQTL